VGLTVPASAQGSRCCQGRTQGGAGLDYNQWQLRYQLGAKTQGGACATSCKVGPRGGQATMINVI
jgi:hypothetical protein